MTVLIDLDMAMHKRAKLQKIANVNGKNTAYMMKNSYPKRGNSN